MYVVMGATGHTGSVIAKKLLAHEKKVRVVGRSAERLSTLVSLGAEPFAADISNKDATARALSGAAAAYVMIPPDLANPNYPAYQDKVAEAIVSALEKGGTGTCSGSQQLWRGQAGQNGADCGTAPVGGAAEAYFGLACAVSARRAFHGEYTAAGRRDSADGSDSGSAETRA